MKKILFLACVVIATFLILDTANAQLTKIRTKVNGRYVHDSLLPKVEKPAIDTVVPADRGVEFNLEKLSYLASMRAYSMANYNENGLVVLELWIDTNGVPTAMGLRESTAPGLGIPAWDAVKKYAKRYKLKPSIFDGKPVETTGLLVPIIIDQTIFQKK